MIRAKKGEVIFYLVMMFAAVILVGFDVSPFLITLLIIYLIIMIRLAVNINENIYIFLFLVCFFIFLIGMCINQHKVRNKTDVVGFRN